MLQLNPSETYRINRILRDWADSTTYYVRAKIYDANSRALLDTENLTDHGSRWFSKDWKVPHDNVYGNGTRLIIVTEVFTDSGYTSKSTNHFDEVEEVLVQQRYNPAVVFGGGDGGWDYKTLLKEIDLIVKKSKEPEPLPEGEEPPPPPEPVELKIARLLEAHTAKIVAEIAGVGAKVSKIPTKTYKDPEKVDLTPLLRAVAYCSELIKTLPKFEKTDLNPVLTQVTRSLTDLKGALTDEIRKQTSKELTLSFADSPESLKGSKRKALLEGLRTKHYGKSS